MLVGGTESMSQAPHVIRGARWGLPFGKEQKLGDTLWDALTDSYTGMPMAITAENLAEQYKISRQECDEYALRSQKTWAAANEAGRFKDEIVPVEIKTQEGSGAVRRRRAPAPADDDGGAGQARPRLQEGRRGHRRQRVGHLRRRGGAGHLLQGSGPASTAGSRWRKLTQWAYTGCDPKIMGIGPAPAIRRAHGPLGPQGSATSISWR